jgi:hypothetical protein
VRPRFLVLASGGGVGDDARVSEEEEAGNAARIRGWSLRRLSSRLEAGAGGQDERGRLGLPPGWVVSMVVGLTVVGAVLRFPGLFTELWLDEIWSIELARSVEWWPEVLTKIRISNNHPLNTWVLMGWGEGRSEAWLRLHSWVAGVATIPLVYWVVRRGGGGGKAALAATFLVTVSFFHVVYASEARGYAVSFACVLISLGAMWRRPEGPGLGLVILFQVCAVMGALANAGFLVFWGALAVWHAGVVLGGLFPIRKGGRRKALRSVGLLGVIHGPVGVLFVGYWWFYVRNLEWVGAGHMHFRGVLERVAEWMFNLGSLPLSLGAAMVFVLASLGWLWLRGFRMQAGLFALAVLVMPFLAFYFNTPKATGYAHLVVLMPQYFFVPASLGLIASGWALGDAMGWVGKRAWLGAVMLAVFAAGAAPMLTSFYRDGRGGFGEAVEHMVATSPGGGEISVGLSQVARDPKELKYYIGRLPEAEAKRFVFPDRAHWAEDPPRWMVGLVTNTFPKKVDSFVARDVSDPDLELRFELERAYRYGEATGYHCLLFQREEERE